MRHQCYLRQVKSQTGCRVCQPACEYIRVIRKCVTHVPRKAPIGRRTGRVTTGCVTMGVSTVAARYVLAAKLRLIEMRGLAMSRAIPILYVL